MRFKGYNKASRGSFSSGFSLASFSRYIPVLLSLGVVGVVVYIGLGLYNKLIGKDSFTDSSDNALATGSSDLTTRAALTATSLQQLENNLAAEGLVVGVAHQANANTLNTLMDSTSVDHDAIVGLVNSMGIESFQLTAIAYGQRELRNYRNSVLHIFEPSVWGDMFSEQKLYGGLKFHLQTVLFSGELSTISAYINSVP